MVKRATFVIQDADGDKSKTSVWMEPGFGADDYSDAARDLAVLIDNVIDGKIIKVQWSDGADTSALTSNTATALADVEELGCFVAKGATRNSGTFFYLPTLDETAVLANSDELDRTDPRVQAVESMLTAGLTLSTTTVVTPCDANGNDLTIVARAAEIFRNSGSKR